MSRRALVLSGGSTAGAVEAGFWKALAEVGVRPDFIVGTSIGALNGAMIAAGLDPEALRRVWVQAGPRGFYRFNWRLLWNPLRADSGLVASMPMEIAVARGADEIVCLACTCQDRPRTPVRGLAAIHSRALAIATEAASHARRCVEMYGGRVRRLLLLEPCLEPSLMPRHALDFRPIPRLLDAAYDHARRQLASVDVGEGVACA